MDYIIVGCRCWLVGDLVAGKVSIWMSGNRKQIQLRGACDESELHCRHGPTPSSQKVRVV
jgi:hypothetical protein